MKAVVAMAAPDFFVIKCGRDLQPAKLWKYWRKEYYENKMGVYSINNLPEDFYKNNPIRYKAYRWNCGRDKRLKEIWGEKAKHWTEGT